ncbi:MAG: ATP synthase F1 subunit epsilon [Clostridiales bacterium]|jgi:F-type H+-transporting ATPase subunit epsilon|nr:ATP synthase F1 subunit epsilon [Clostridiales bacterium]
MAAEKTFRFTLLTPTRKLAEQDVVNVIFRAETGDVGILAGHEPIITTLGYGSVRVFDKEGTETVFTAFGGFAEMDDNNNLRIMSDKAERADEIDVERAKSAAERSRRAQAEKTDALAIRKAELAFRRAQVRLEVSSYPIIQGKHDDL